MHLIILCTYFHAVCRVSNWSIFLFIAVICDACVIYRRQLRAVGSLSKVSVIGFYPVFLITISRSVVHCSSCCEPTADVNHAGYVVPSSSRHLVCGLADVIRPPR